MTVQRQIESGGGTLDVYVRSSFFIAEGAGHVPTIARRDDVGESVKTLLAAI